MTNHDIPPFTHKRFIYFTWHLIIFYFLFVISSTYGFLLSTALPFDMPLRSIIFTVLVFITISTLIYIIAHFFYAIYLLKPIKISVALVRSLCTVTAVIISSILFIGNRTILSELSVVSWDNVISCFTIQKAHHVFQTTNNNLIILTIIAACIVGPIIEELVFRGILFEYCTSLFKHSETTVIVVSIIFALCHQVDAFGPFLNHIIFSIAICLLRQKYCSIYPGIIIHMTNNLISIFLLFL